jgi:hypothetical protein
MSIERIIEKAKAAWAATKRFMAGVVERVLDFCHATVEACAVATLPTVAATGSANLPKAAAAVATTLIPQKPLIAGGALIKAGLAKAGIVTVASALTVGTGAAAICVALGFIGFVRWLKNSKKPVEQTMSDIGKTAITFEKVVMAA